MNVIISIPTTPGVQSKTDPFDTPACEDPPPPYSGSDPLQNDPKLKQLLAQLMQELAKNINDDGSKQDDGGGDAVSQGLQDVGSAMQTPQAPTGPSPEQLNARMDTKATLLKYKDTFGKGMTMDDIKKKANDPNTQPPELKQALTSLANDPDLLKEIDGTCKGKHGKDGIISAGDIVAANNTPDMKTYNQKLADGWKADNPPGSKDANIKAASTLQRYADKFNPAKSVDDMRKMADDPNTPPDLKEALTTVVNNPSMLAKLDSAKNGKFDGAVGAADIAKLNDDPDVHDYSTKLADSWKNDDPPGAKDERLDAVSVLQRHADVFKSAPSIDDLHKMIDDPKTPPDLKQALQTVVNDPALMAKLDSVGNGKFDGRIGKNDIDKLSQDPDLKALNEKKAAKYEQDYIPSDDGGKHTQGRPIMEGDAQTELEKYSDYLPKNVSLAELQKIVDGTGGEGKRPPQLIAAAKYYVDHPDQWKALNGGSDQISNAKMQDNIRSKHVMSQDDLDTMDRLHDDPNHVFFGGGNLTRDKLQKIVDDPKADPADKKAAQTMLQHSGLFSWADNAKNGNDIHGIKGAWLKSDDGQISRKDIDALWNQHHNDVPPPVAEAPPPAGGAPSPHLPADPNAAKSSDPATDAKATDDKKADFDMVSGELDQPDIKKAKGGVLKDVVNGLIKVGGLILKVGSKLLQKIGELEIPGISQLAQAGAIAARAGAAGLDVGSAALNGDNVKTAAIKAGIDVGMAAVGSFVPGGSAAVKGAAKGAEEAAEGAAKGITKGTVVKETAKGIAGEAGSAALGAATDGDFITGLKNDASYAASSLSKGDFSGATDNVAKMVQEAQDGGFYNGLGNAAGGAAGSVEKGDYKKGLDKAGDVIDML